MIQDTVVIGGECSLETRIEGDCDLTSMVEGDPDVLVVEGGGQTYPHYSGSYVVTPSASQQVLQTDGKVMDNDVTVQAVAQGSATTPATIITADPTISVSSGGLITSTVSKTQQITPTVVEGYVSAGTPGNVGVSGSNTQQLSTQGAQTIHPASTDQSIAPGKYLTGAQTFKAVTVSGLTADKVLQGTTVEIGDSDDSDRIMKVVGTAQGGITPTGTKSITANGTNIDVAQYAYADVAVPNSYSASDEGKVVSNGALVAQTSDTVTANDTYDTTLINSLTVNVSGSSGYTLSDITERTGITGDVVYNSGSQSNLITGVFAETKITSFTSTKLTGAENGVRAFYHCTELLSVSLPNLVNSNTGKLTDCFGQCTKLVSASMPKYEKGGSTMFTHCTALTTVDFSACTEVPQSTFEYCSSLTTLDLPVCTKINNTAFNNCTSLNALILRKDSVCALNNQNSLQNTPLRGYGGTYSGHVYVPSSLIASYKTASNWSSIYAAYNDIFKAIEGSIYE